MSSSGEGSVDGSLSVPEASIDTLFLQSTTSSTHESQTPLIIHKKSYAQLRDDDFEYKMNNKRRGRAVIINNRKFHSHIGMKERKGTDVDRDELCRTLMFLGFRKDDILVENDVTVEKLISVVKEVAKENHKDSDCLFIAILSHGDEGLIYGIDGSVVIEDLLKPFKEAGSESLIRKPKIFLVQACRGQKLDDGRYFASDSGTTEEKPVYKIAKESDFLYAYSTVPGYYSWRNNLNGSWFIQAFCEVMLRDGRRLEFVHALTRVNHIVSYNFESFVTDPELQHMNKKKESPCITSMLTKLLYF